YQLSALLSGEDYWADVAALAGRATPYARTGRLLPLPSQEARALAEARAETAADLWQGRAVWRISDDSGGWLSECAAPFGCVHETLSARIFPQTALALLADAFRRAGGRLLEGWPVATLGDGCAEGPRGAWAGEAVVLAAGVAGFDLLAPLLGTAPGSGVKGQAAVLAATCRGDEPILFHDGLYIVPHAPGRVAVGSTSEAVWDAQNETDALLDDVITRARSLCPRLDGAEVVTRWAGVRPKARRRDPMLGPVPGHPSLFAALGGFKIGFGIAPKVGDTLADLIAGAPVELPPSFTVAHHL
ncbi:MAG: FAD-dependent oxidoreductase, partial [Pseudomonadota bacterium]